MTEDGYLQWFVSKTSGRWWNDSANTTELTSAKEYGATGVTTNPLLVQAAVEKGSNAWADEVRTVAASDLKPAERAEAVTTVVVARTAELFMPAYTESDGGDGYVCAQVNPGLFSDSAAMHAMAKRYAALAENIAVKLPVNEAGLDVLEDCVAEGITVTATVSFTVSQAVAVAERHRKGALRAERAGIRPGRCFAVIMIGRVDDYLKDLARDGGYGLAEDALNWAGLAVVKRAYSLYRESGYATRLLVAAMRGSYHMTELSGAALTMSIHPNYRDPLLSGDLPKEERIDCPVPVPVIDRLYRIPDFVRAYEPDGLRVKEFASFGLFQRTITQFYESGWRLLERQQKK